MAENETRNEEGTAAGKNASPVPTEDWQRDLLNRLLFATLNEQRRARRWGIFFKSLLFLWLFALLFAISAQRFGPQALHPGRHTAVVDVDGIIADGARASADRVISGLRAAFDDSHTAGVIVRINSPGGSPVQAGYINDEIRRLRKLHPRIPVYAVVTDICASGGYYVAVATDKIFADQASIVGSIGVRMDSFGFVDALKKLGVERRLITAGAHKGFLDPFLPEKPAEVAHVKQMLEQIHQQFIQAVKRGRGDRLADDPDLFSGLVWTGAEGVKLGLVDALGSPRYVARQVIGAPRMVDFTPRRDLFERLSREVGTSVGKGFGHWLEQGPVLR
ncbi:MAG TPA: S49 family peptidase [Gammaproteobacteria bacterium]|nr:S49 family peptidase [Gammaproteobacteria bacterium]